jgi:integrase
MQISTVLNLIYGLLLYIFMLVEKFCDVVALQSDYTALQYTSRLRSFDYFLRKKYKTPIDHFFKKKFDVYEVLSGYHFYLRENGLQKSTISSKIATAKLFLEYNGILISNSMFRLRVRAPKQQHTEKEALNKDLVRKIILACQDRRLQAYVLLLAATGMRATEAHSIRYRDIDWERRKVMIRAEYTKTKRQRFVFLTEECIKHLKIWKEHRERERRIIHNGIHHVKRPYCPDDLFFTTGRHSEVINPRNMYHAFIPIFHAVLDLNGFQEREESGRRHKITLHSFRRFVKSTISDLGYQDYSEWYIGHSGSTYYRKTEAEKLAIFKKIEPYLTYLDYSELEAKGADIETKLQEKDDRITNLEKQLGDISKMLYEAGILKKD